MVSHVLLDFQFPAMNRTDLTQVQVNWANVTCKSHPSCDENKGAERQQAQDKHSRKVNTFPYASGEHLSVCFTLYSLQ